MNKNTRSRFALQALLIASICVGAQAQQQSAGRPINQDSTDIFPLTGPPAHTVYGGDFWLFGYYYSGYWLK